MIAPPETAQQARSLRLLFDDLLADQSDDDPPCQDTDFAKKRVHCDCRRCALAVVERYEARTRGGDYVVRECDLQPRSLLPHSVRAANGIAKHFGYAMPFPFVRAKRWKGLERD